MKNESLFDEHVINKYEAKKRKIVFFLSLKGKY
jgi:hypothetical protein